jgi:redox-sensitive bicupin YhaK (pirin superfamily)
VTRILGRRQLLVGATAATALACAPAPIVRGRASPSLTSRGIADVLAGQASRDGAGVSLTRHFGHSLLERLDPFVLLDEIHSSVPADYERGFPSHPHRGFETVSVMLDGRMRHRDSRGNSGLITGGGAQWMTAGSGIVHSEMPEEDPALGTELWGFQLWVNLPRAEKMRTPEYQDLGPERLAEVELDHGGRLRVIAGELLGARGPVAARPTEPVLATLAMNRGDDVELRVPRDHNAVVLVAEGEAEIGPRRERLGEGAVAILDGRGELVRIRASVRSAQVLVMAGAPIREPIVQAGPFVMNTEAEIRDAWADYRAGTLG